MNSRQELSEKEMRKEVSRLKKNISRRLDRIAKKPDTLSQFSVKKYKEIENLNDLKNLNAEQVRVLYRDLKYVNSLKSATVKGAYEAKQNFEEIRNHLDTLSQEKQDEFWSTYQKALEESPLYKNYKYEVFEHIIDSMFEGQGSDKIINDIIEAYKRTSLQLGDDYDEKDFKELFDIELFS